MGGLFKKMPVTAIAFLASTLAISGIPPFSGFFSKDEILWNTFASGHVGLYMIAFLAAGLTAFYMFRLFVYTFLGSFSGDHEPHPLPWTMDGPVAILGFMAVVGGLVGIPEVLGGHNPFHHWLAYLTPKVVHHGANHSTELALMGASTGWALVMSGMAIFLYRRNLEWTHTLKRRLKVPYGLMLNKFYVDEIYEYLILKPILWISRNLLWKVADVKLVDGLLVHGWADVTRFTAGLISRLQSGVLSHYVFYLWIGLGALLVYLVKA